MPIDARLKARRIEVMRAQGRQRLRRLVIALIVAGAITLVVGAVVWSPVLRIRHVRVDGVDGGLLTDVERVAGQALGGSLVTADTASLEALLLRDPRVAAARVSKEPPGTLRVAVARRIPIAQAAVGSGYAVLAADGVVVDVLGFAVPDLPGVLAEGVPAQPGARATTAAAALQVLAGLPPSVGARVRQVQQDASGGLTLVLDGGVSAVFGPPENSVRKGQVLEALMVDAAARGWSVTAYNVISPEAPALTSAATA